MYLYVIKAVASTVRSGTGPNIIIISGPIHIAKVFDCMRSMPITIREWDTAGTAFPHGWMVIYPNPDHQTMGVQIRRTIAIEPINTVTATGA